MIVCVCVCVCVCFAFFVKCDLYLIEWSSQSYLTRRDDSDSELRTSQVEIYIIFDKKHELFYLLYNFWHFTFIYKMPAAILSRSTKPMIDRVSLQHLTTPQCMEINF